MPDNLTDCVDCEKRISRNSVFCIHCGSNTPHMTKGNQKFISVLSVFFAIAMVVLMVSMYLIYEVF